MESRRLMPPTLMLSISVTKDQKVAEGASFAGMTLDEIERQTILQALERHKGNLSQVATALGISRAALYRRLEKFGISV